MRAVYEKLCVDLSEIYREERLSFNFRALNYVFYAKAGICSITLVFEVYPKIYGVHDRGTLIQRVPMIAKCSAILARMKPQRTFEGSGKGRSIPDNPQIEKVRSLPSGHQGLLYRKASQRKEYELVGVCKARSEIDTKWEDMFFPNESGPSCLQKYQLRRE